MIIKYVRPKVYNYQERIIDSPARFTVTEAATKVGKTASHIIWLNEQSLGIKDYKKNIIEPLPRNSSVWWVAPVYGQAEIAFNRLRNQVSYNKYFTKNESKLRLTTPEGVHIHFKTAEKPDNLYGDDVYAAVFDEFTRAREAAWIALRSTLTATKAKCKFIGNVKGKKNWGYKMAQKAKQGAEGYEHFKITAYDAAEEGLLSLDEILQAKADLPPLAFAELYEAEAADDGTNPFGFAEIERCIKPLSYKEAICYGIDLAKSVDYTVIIGLDNAGDVCYVNRFQRNWEQTKEIIRLLPRNKRITIDSTGVGDPIVEELQKDFHLMEGFKFTSSSKQQLMEGLSAAIHQRTIGFPDGVIPDELKCFEFEYTRTGVKYTAPEGFHDDCVCALALAKSGHTISKTHGKYSII